MGSETGTGVGGAEVALKKIEPRITTANTASITMTVVLLMNSFPLADGGNNNDSDS